jgi:hypothetical protein
LAERLFGDDVAAVPPRRRAGRTNKDTERLITMNFGGYEAHAGTKHPMPRGNKVRWQPETYLLQLIYCQDGIDKIRMI